MSRRGALAVKRMLLEHSAELLVPEAMDPELAAELRIRPPALVLTPELWRSACRGTAPQHERRCGRCELCRHERRLNDAAFIRPGSGPRGAPDAIARAYAWPSVDAALACWSAQGGGGMRYSYGKLLERARDNLGPSTSTTPNDTVMVEAAMLGAVTRAVVRAFSRPEDRLGLPLERCTRILVLRSRGTELAELASGLGLDVGLVTAIAKHGRRVVRIELCARGLVPPPRMRDGIRLDVAIRRQELARTG